MGEMKMIYYVIALFVIAIDQISKWLIVKNMELGTSIPIIDNVLYITSHRNRGAAWGILENKMWFFYIITVVFVVFIVFYMKKYAKTDKLLGISLGLILGGAIGNFIDRVFRQEVVDFIHVYIFSYNYPVFNIADSALCIGVVLIIIQTLLEGKKAKE
ncbi:Lipoprotein signal peptidase [Bacillus thuringiensis IBL 200]|nr:Lipoprotein signal peptidase [Bacillus cereus m1550]EEM27579.1 Lipoprotein signal peptidase [Bacillus thuringiensis Bt407]EEM33783.1 Lipoprotein signal peptidase [Bacillus thuringiensis serovar thuringiensis str. T01001]EEM40503.1 Lipoprotein signal peptidase [Bacillus thuringiensis serovar sotto str. T04001]EEM46580.1 Lipoprotein signal peptidase [Bacillus thuringiensis serovar pakistani str. T13001]EEM64728.1 Lipoprotein signal peptidase [Bacillus thuringiensis serovar berliner ATCC 10792